MFEHVFKIKKSHLKKLETLCQRLLKNGEIIAYFFEYENFSVYLKVYSNSEFPPQVTGDLILLSSSLVEENWSAKWALQYNGCELTPDIYVLPEGKALPATPYKYIIYIDPFDAFGDGHHPTTRMCSKMLTKLFCEIGTEHSMLDVGTGSGILSIVSWLLGLRDIELFDYDGAAVEKAKKNLKLNGIDDLIPFVADLYNFSTERKYKVITANLLSRIIEDNIEKLKDLAMPGGHLLLSGISILWKGDMEKLFLYHGFNIKESLTDDEWCAFWLETPL